MKLAGIGIVMVTLGLIGCAQLGDVAAKGLTGAYLGEGEFHGEQGSLDAKAQLELREDGSYQLLWLEPSPMALFGVEDGTWSETSESVVLTPVEKEAKAGSGTFAKLSAASSKSSQPKTLEKEGDEIKWSDGKMDLVFRKN